MSLFKFRYWSILFFINKYFFKRNPRGENTLTNRMKCMYFRRGLLIYNCQYLFMNLHCIKLYGTLVAVKCSATRFCWRWIALLLYWKCVTWVDWKQIGVVDLCLTSLESQRPQHELTVTYPEHSSTSPAAVMWGFWAKRLYSRTKHEVTLSRSTAETTASMTKTANPKHCFHMITNWK